MRNLTSFMILLPLTIVLTISFLPLSSCHLISDTCDQTPKYLLCTSTLRKDPRSRTANVTGLGLIMVEAVKAKAKAALDQIKELQTSNPLSKDELMECSENYNVILKVDIPKAVQSLKENPKFAENGMADSAIEAQGCENSLKRSHRKSPLTDVNKQVYELSNIARFIIKFSHSTKKIVDARLDYADFH